MSYLYYIIDKLNLFANSFSITVVNNTNKNGTTGKMSAGISLSAKDSKIHFMLYFVLIFFVGFSLSLFFACFPSINVWLEKEIIKINNFGFGKTILLSLVIMIINFLIILIKRYMLFKTKESKPKNINIYNRELPANLTPAHARLLTTDGKMDAKTLAATILDLIDRGYLKLESNNREDLFKKDLLISKTDKSQDDLFEYEKYLINWFFDKEQISSLDLRKRLNDHSTNPCDKFGIFQGLLLLSFPLDKYYNNNRHKQINQKAWGILFIISTMLAFPNIFIKNVLFFAITQFIAMYSLGKVIFSQPTYLLNDDGAETRDSYLDLKRFLTDFSLINEKSSEMIILWNYYLSYSVALDLDVIAGDEIINFFGNNIYNFNNQSSIDEEETKKLIENIPNEIIKSKKIYNKRNIIY